jgi:hypothetical protein
VIRPTWDEVTKHKARTIRRLRALMAVASLADPV